MCERVEGAAYYKWSAGVRLRGNLDELEGWASDNHLQDEASQHLVKLNCLVDLLATPKLQLQQVRVHVRGFVSWICKKIELFYARSCFVCPCWRRSFDNA